MFGVRGLIDGWGDIGSETQNSEAIQTFRMSGDPPFITLSLEIQPQ